MCSSKKGGREEDDEKIERVCKLSTVQRDEEEEEARKE
jgi:hypothetical protein